MSEKEKDLLKMIGSLFTKSDKQLNNINESDSEIVELDKGTYAINIDDYCPEEDFFSDIDPYKLGHNLVIATISDLIATGAVPKFFLHSMTLPKSKEMSFNENLLRGVSDALKLNSCSLLGGDTSTDENWRYTGVAIGMNTNVVKRSGSAPGDLIFSTGQFGAGNRQALTQMLLKEEKMPVSNESLAMATPLFKSRLNESKVISKFATSMIDSSDGLINSIGVLHENNPSNGYTINLSQELIDPETAALAGITQITYETFAFGTLGEYELVFTVKESDKGNFLQECEKIGFTPLQLGAVTDSENIEVSNGNRTIVYDGQLPDPRSAEVEVYIQKLLEFIKVSFYA